MNTILPLHGKRGVDLLHDPLLNKGTAFNEAERDEFGLRGLLPPRVTTQEQQLERVLDNIRRKTDLLQGTLDMMILRVLSRGELHGWGITQNWRNSRRVRSKSTKAPSTHPSIGWRRRAGSKPSGR